VNRTKVAVVEAIRRREFDAVVVGSASSLYAADGGRDGQQVVALWNLATQYYGPQDIIIIDGMDPPGPNNSRIHRHTDALADSGHYFLREIPDAC